MKWALTSLLIGASLSLGACATPAGFYARQMPLSEQADQFNVAAADAERLMIVRNVMRARDRTSMIFTRVQDFSASMQSSASTTASIGLTEGPANATLTPGVTIGAQTTPGFNLAVLNDEKFHRAIESSIDLSIYEMLLRNGWRPNLLNTLFIERIVVNGAEFENDPGHGYEDFRARLADAGGRPLMVCSKSVSESVGPVISSPTLEGIAAVNERDLSISAVRGGAQVVGSDVRRWFAYDCDKEAEGFTAVTMEMSQATPQAPAAPLQSVTISTDANGSHPGDRRDENRVYVRSIEGVLFYLGEVVRAQQRENGRPVTFVDTYGGASVSQQFFRVDVADEEALRLQLQTRSPVGIVFRHEDGRVYRVPYPDYRAQGENLDRTHQVISLMVQLIGMIQQHEGVPVTQPVRVVN